MLCCAVLCHALMALLGAGSALLTAGYCLYSSSTIFVLTTGNGVYGFTLDPLVGEFILSHDNVKVTISCSFQNLKMLNADGE